MQRFGLVLLVGVLGCAESPPLPDSSTPDTSPPDAGQDSTVDVMEDVMEDSNPPDTSADTQPDAGGLTCRYTPDDLIELGSDTGRPDRRVVLAPREDGAWATWTQEDAGRTNVYGRWIPVEGEPGLRRTVTRDFGTQRSPTAFAVDAGVTVTWVDNMTGGFELWSARVDLDPFEVATPEARTSTAGAEETPAAVRTGTDGLLAWVETAESSRTLRVQRQSADGSLTGEGVTLAPDQAPRDPALAQLLGGQMLVAWRNEDELWAQRVTGTEPFAVPGQIDEGHRVVGPPSVAAGPFAGAVVADVLVDGVRPEFRFRMLDADGEVRPPVAAPLEVSETAANASVAALRDGFAVLYRSLDAPGLAQPMMRLVTVDARGRFVRRFDIESTERLGGPSTIVSTWDGSLMLAWSELDSEGQVSLRAARIACDE